MVLPGDVFGVVGKHRHLDILRFEPLIETDQHQLVAEVPAAVITD